MNTPEPPAEVVHACPPGDEGITPCCGVTPFELPRWTSRITTDPALVTCTGGAVPDTGQARPHHLVTSHWDAAGGEVLYRSCTCGEEWARDEDRCPVDDIETLDVDDLLDRLDLIQARNPDEQRHLDDTLDALRRELAEPSGETVQAPDMAAFASEMVARTSMAPSKPLLPWPELPQDLAFLAVVIDRLRAGAQIMAAELALQGVDQAAADDIRHRAALLGTDTTPDRLAWISKAGETAAVERQARYQETACARRPAATSGGPAQPDLAYARSEVDKWLADNDPYCILPTRTEHIPALLARLDELEGTS